MSETKATSFLAQIKGEMTAIFDESLEEMAQQFEDQKLEGIPDTMKTLRRKCWELMEKSLKASYLNGKKASGKPDTSETTRKPNPFRK